MKLAALTLVALATAAPATTITSGPSGDSTNDSPTFTFTADGATSFQCSLDGKAFATCSSPYALRSLAVGRHSFTVRSVDAAGEVEQSPPVREWNLLPSPLVAPTVKLRQPARRTMSRAGLRVIAGSASSPTGVGRVQLALEYGKENKDVFPPSCHFVDLSTGQKVAQACFAPVYVTVRGTKNWTYRVPARVRKQLKPNRYTLIIRAFNPSGQATRKRLPLTLR